MNFKTAVGQVHFNYIYIPVLTTLKTSTLVAETRL
jgi:hypothetical protein